MAKGLEGLQFRNINIRAWYTMCHWWWVINWCTKLLVFFSESNANSCFRIPNTDYFLSIAMLCRIVLISLELMAKRAIILYSSVVSPHLVPMAQVSKFYILTCVITLQSDIADLSDSNCSVSAFKVPEWNSAVRRSFKEVSNQTIMSVKNFSS